MTMNYEIFPLWLLATGTVPSPLWAADTIPSSPLEWFFPWPWVVFSHGEYSTQSSRGPSAHLRHSLSVRLLSPVPRKLRLPWLSWTPNSILNLGRFHVLSRSLPLHPPWKRSPGSKLSSHRAHLIWFLSLRDRSRIRLLEFDSDSGPLSNYSTSVL